MAIRKHMFPSDGDMLFNHLLGILVDLEVITPEERADRVKGPMIFAPGAYSQMMKTIVNTEIEDLNKGSVLLTLLDAIGGSDDDDL